MKTEETYLGDGLYASYDGYHIVLRAPKINGDEVVALEPDVFDRLLAFADDVYKLDAKDK